MKITLSESFNKKVNSNAVTTIGGRLDDILLDSVKNVYFSNGIALNDETMNDFISYDETKLNIEINTFLNENDTDMYNICYYNVKVTKYYDTGDPSWDDNDLTDLDVFPTEGCYLFYICTWKNYDSYETDSKLAVIKYSSNLNDSAEKIVRYVSADDNCIFFVQVKSGDNSYLKAFHTVINVDELITCSEASISPSLENINGFTVTNNNLFIVEGPGTNHPKIDWFRISFNLNNPVFTDYADKLPAISADLPFFDGIYSNNELVMIKFTGSLDNKKYLMVYEVIDNSCTKVSEEYFDTGYTSSVDFDMISHGVKNIDENRSIISLYTFNMSVNNVPDKILMYKRSNTASVIKYISCNNGVKRFFIKKNGLSNTQSFYLFDTSNASNSILLYNTSDDFLINLFNSTSSETFIFNNDNYTTLDVFSNNTIRPVGYKLTDIKESNVMTFNLIGYDNYILLKMKKDENYSYVNVYNLNTNKSMYNGLITLDSDINIVGGVLILFYKVANIIKVFESEGSFVLDMQYRSIEGLFRFYKTINGTKTYLPPDDYLLNYQNNTLVFNNSIYDFSLDETETTVIINADIIEVNENNSRSYKPVKFIDNGVELDNIRLIFYKKVEDNFFILDRDNINANLYIGNAPKKTSGSNQYNLKSNRLVFMSNFKYNNVASQYGVEFKYGNVSTKTVEINETATIDSITYNIHAYYKDTNDIVYAIYGYNYQPDADGKYYCKLLKRTQSGSTVTYSIETTFKLEYLYCDKMGIGVIDTIEDLIDDVGNIELCIHGYYEPTCQINSMIIGYSGEVSDNGNLKAIVFWNDGDANMETRALYQITPVKKQGNSYVTDTLNLFSGCVVTVRSTKANTTTNKYDLDTIFKNGELTDRFTEIYETYTSVIPNIDLAKKSMLHGFLDTPYPSTYTADDKCDKLFYIGLVFDQVNTNSGTVFEGGPQFKYLPCTFEFTDIQDNNTRYIYKDGSSDTFKQCYHYSFDIEPPTISILEATLDTTSFDGDESDNTTETYLGSLKLYCAYDNNESNSSSLSNVITFTNNSRIMYLNGYMSYDYASEDDIVTETKGLFSDEPDYNPSALKYTKLINPDIMVTESIEGNISIESSATIYYEYLNSLGNIVAASSTYDRDLFYVSKTGNEGLPPTYEVNYTERELTISGNKYVLNYPLYIKVANSRLLVLKDDGTLNLDAVGIDFLSTMSCGQLGSDGYFYITNTPETVLAYLTKDNNKNLNELSNSEETSFDIKVTLKNDDFLIIEELVVSCFERDSTVDAAFKNTTFHYSTIDGVETPKNQLPSMFVTSNDAFAYLKVNNKLGLLYSDKVYSKIRSYAYIPFVKLPNKIINDTSGKKTIFAANNEIIHQFINSVDEQVGTVDANELKVYKYNKFLKLTDITSKADYNALKSYFKSYIKNDSDTFSNLQEFFLNGCINSNNIDIINYNVTNHTDNSVITTNFNAATHEFDLGTIYCTDKSNGITLNLANLFEMDAKRKYHKYQNTIYLNNIKLCDKNECLEVLYNLLIGYYKVNTQLQGIVKLIAKDLSLNIVNGSYGNNTITIITYDAINYTSNYTILKYKMVDVSGVAPYIYLDTYEKYVNRVKYFIDFKIGLSYEQFTATIEIGNNKKITITQDDVDENGIYEGQYIESNVVITVTKFVTYEGSKTFSYRRDIIIDNIETDSSVNEPLDLSITPQLLTSVYSPMILNRSIYGLYEFTLDGITYQEGSVITNYQKKITNHVLTVKGTHTKTGKVYGPVEYTFMIDTIPPHKPMLTNISDGDIISLSKNNQPTKIYIDSDIDNNETLHYSVFINTIPSSAKESGPSQNPTKTLQVLSDRDTNGRLYFNLNEALSYNSANASYVITILVYKQSNNVYSMNSYYIDFNNNDIKFHTDEKHRSIIALSSESNLSEMSIKAIAERIHGIDKDYESNNEIIVDYSNGDMGFNMIDNKGNEIRNLITKLIRDQFEVSKRDSDNILLTENNDIGNFYRNLYYVISKLDSIKEQSDGIFKNNWNIWDLFDIIDIGYNQLRNDLLALNDAGETVLNSMKTEDAILKNKKELVKLKHEMIKLLNTESLELSTNGYHLGNYDLEYKGQNNVTRKFYNNFLTDCKSEDVRFNGLFLSYYDVLSKYNLCNFNFNNVRYMMSTKLTTFKSTYSESNTTSYMSLFNREIKYYQNVKKCIGMWKVY